MKVPDFHSGGQFECMLINIYEGQLSQKILFTPMSSVMQYINSLQHRDQ